MAVLFGFSQTFLPVNQGGWVPASLLRSIIENESPRYMKRAADYVLFKMEGKPLTEYRAHVAAREKNDPKSNTWCTLL